MDYSDDLPTIEKDTDLELQKIDLGDAMSSLFHDLEASDEPFETEQATYAFSDPTFIEGAWIPHDIAEYLTASSCSLRNVDVSYDLNTSLPRPRMAIVLYLTNGERVYLEKDPSDFRKTGFDMTSSDPSIQQSSLDADDIGHFVASILFSKADKPDTSVARLLAGPSEKNELDPTNGAIYSYIMQLLEMRADTWKREETKLFDVEDDTNTVALSKVSYSNGLTENKVSFFKQGTDLDASSFFELVAQQSMSPGESILLTTLDYERGNEDGTEKGSSDSHRHYYDYMQAVIHHCKKYLVRSAKAKEALILEELSDLDPDQIRRLR